MNTVFETLAEALRVATFQPSARAHHDFREVFPIEEPPSRPRHQRRPPAHRFRR
jgi:hypothetical protein